MVKRFPKAMKGVDEETLYRYFNKSVPGLIRVESPELYYNFHVIIRFEIEEEIFNGQVKTQDLPALWNEKYKKYLGLKPKTYSEGILQDSHWASAAFGYFPTYTLGNLISGSLSQMMKKEIKGFDKLVRNAEFTPVRKWLKEKIHRHGRSITTKDIVGEIRVKDYLTYLEDKFRK